MENDLNIELADILEAYNRCRKGNSTPDAIAFKVNYQEECYELWREIVERRYSPRPSTAFVVKKPVRREIIAADFRDRIVHHYIGIRLEPLFEEVFIDETTNCRKGKGTSYGIGKLHDSIYRLSNGYSKDCWVLKLDIKSFFMCINKKLLWDKLLNFVDAKYNASDKQTLIYLMSITLNNNPVRNCRFRSPRREWKDIPRQKSLFTTPPDCGVAPGNLPSQIWANFFLNDFDHQMKCLFQEYGRYVDDFYAVSSDKESLLEAIPIIAGKLSEIGLTLHPKKIYLQHYSKGVKYIGAVLKNERKYISNRTVGNFYSAIERFNRLARQDGYVELHAVDFACSINSYLGFLRQCQSYGIRRKAIRRISKPWWKVVYVSGHFEKITVKRKYKHPLNDNDYVRIQKPVHI